MEDELTKEIESIIESFLGYEARGQEGVEKPTQIKIAEAILTLIRKREIELNEKCKSILPYLECYDDMVMHDC